MSDLMKKRSLLSALSVLLLLPSVSWAADRATVIFKSGQVVTIEDGYKQIVESMKSSASNSTARSRILELNIGGGSFLLNIDEVVVVCRDDCRSLTIRHQLDPARAKSGG
jgi:hypothetical protein